MKKLTTILLASTLVGTLGAAALTPALAHGWNNNGWNNGPRGMMGQNWGDRDGRMGQNWRDHMRGDMMGRGGFHHGMGRGGSAMLGFVCSPNGAVRLGAMLGGLEQRLKLTDTQQPLFDDLKTTALSAQADVAGACPATPGANAQASIVDRLKNREAVLNAEADALGKVVPKLQALYDSLTDTQKKAFSLRGMRGDGWGRNGWDRDGWRQGPNNQQGPNAQGPGNGPGMNNQNGMGQGPGNGQGIMKRDGTGPANSDTM